MIFISNFNKDSYLETAVMLIQLSTSLKQSDNLLYCWCIQICDKKKKKKKTLWVISYMRAL